MGQVECVYCGDKPLLFGPIADLARYGVLEGLSTIGKQVIGICGPCFTKRRARRSLQSPSAEAALAPAAGR